MYLILPISGSFHEQIDPNHLSAFGMQDRYPNAAASVIVFLLFKLSKSNLYKRGAIFSPVAAGSHDSPMGSFGLYPAGHRQAWGVI
ncbi:MAG: hypothetical protein RO469_15660 [Thermincola sp.]|jgi:poly(A) polymerase Pap1|nr:hypothetical protein [Thermincola sp.]